MAVPEGIITTSDILVPEEVEEVTAPAEVEEVIEEVETDAEV